MKINKINAITKVIKQTEHNAPKGIVQQHVKKLKAKEYPNWVGLPGDNYGPNRIAETVAFYPTDLEKMKSMPPKEVEAYKDRLFFEHRYYIDNTPKVMSKELAEFMSDLCQY